VYVRSVNEWCDAAENLNKWAGAKPTNFVLFMEQVDEAKALPKEAKKEYGAHVTRHGC
jgi:hypothetical protein